MRDGKWGRRKGGRRKVGKGREENGGRGKGKRKGAKGRKEEREKGRKPTNEPSANSRVYRKPNSIKPFMYGFVYYVGCWMLVYVCMYACPYVRLSAYDSPCRRVSMLTPVHDFTESVTML